VRTYESYITYQRGELPVEHAELTERQLGTVVRAPLEAEDQSFTKNFIQVWKRITSVRNPSVIANRARNSLCITLAGLAVNAWVTWPTPFIGSGTFSQINFDYRPVIDIGDDMVFGFVPAAIEPQSETRLLFGILPAAQPYITSDVDLEALYMPDRWRGDEDNLQHSKRMGALMYRNPFLGFGKTDKQ
jgi:hypothetical protein